MTATVTPLHTNAGAPLTQGDTTQILESCEARVRHAADRLNTAITAMHDLRDMAAQIRRLNGKTLAAAE